MWLALHKPVVSLRNSKVLCAINEHHGKWVVLNLKASVWKSRLFRPQSSFYLQKFPLLTRISLSILPIHALLLCSLYKGIFVFVLLFPVYWSPIRAAITLSVLSSAYETVCILHRVIQEEMSTFWEVIISVIVRKICSHEHVSIPASPNQSYIQTKDKTNENTSKWSAI